MADTHVWEGRSGRYDYEVFDRRRAPRTEGPCVYIMAKLVRSSWVAVHIGYAEHVLSLGPGPRTRLSDCIDQEHPTHVHVGRRPKAKASNLRDEVEDIKEKHKPLCDRSA